MLPSSKELVFENVGTDWEELPFVGFPDKFTIIRAQAEIKSGDGAELALSVRTRSEPTDSKYVALQYDLVEELDYTERQVVTSYKIRDIDIGKLFCAVRADTGTNNTIAVLLEYVTL